MSEYRQYLQGQRAELESHYSGRRKKHFRGWILLLLLLAAVYAYFSKTLDIDKLKVSGKKTMSSFSELDLVDAINILNSTTFGDRELPIYSVETDEKKVALSFDAAWGAEDFEKIMEVLDKHKVKVTFFMTGNWVEDNPDCVKELVEKGHDLGNHSEHHYDMTTLSTEDMAEELEVVHNRVKELTDYDMFLFRPPYGAYDNDLINTAKSLNYYPIQWSVDSLDWKDYGVDSIISTVCDSKDLGPGAIILCHNGATYTAQALDTLITKIEDQGYTLVPISELIIRDGYHMDVNGRQIKD